MPITCEYCRVTKSTNCGDPPEPCIDGVKAMNIEQKELAALADRGFKKVGCYCIGIYVNEKTGQFNLQTEDCCNCP